MVLFKWVPTAVSNYQKEDSEGSSGKAAGVGCGRGCLRVCCIEGATLPLYACNKGGQNAENKNAGEPPVAFLDALLLKEWEDRMRRGIFSYDFSFCETKVVPGEYGFIAQINEARHLKKRPTEFRRDQVLQPFDGTKFNFTKVGQQEILFQFEANQDGEASFNPSAPVNVESSTSVVAINLNPIEYGHVILIPWIFQNLPQRIDCSGLLLALQMAAEAGSPYFRVGYNSLGAFGTVNHLHFQAYYLEAPYPVEKAPFKRIATVNKGVTVSNLLNYPVRGLVFEGEDSLQDLAKLVSAACKCLEENNMPYNLLISQSGRRIYLLPQCFAEKLALGLVSTELLDTQVLPGFWELSGHIILKRREDFEEASEENAWRILAEASLSEEKFRGAKALIFNAIGVGTALADDDWEEEGAGGDASFLPALSLQGLSAAGGV